MTPRIFAFCSLLALPGCALFEDIVTGLSEFERDFRANPIYAYGTRDDTGIGRVSGLTVTHISPDNTALDRWRKDSTTIAGGNFATHRKIEFSPEITYIGLSQCEPFSTAGTDCDTADCTIVIYDSDDGDERLALKDDDAGDLVWQNCDAPTPPQDAITALSQLRALDEVPAFTEGRLNRYEGARLIVVPFDQIGDFGFDSLPRTDADDFTATREELDWDGWVSANEIIWRYRSTDMILVRLLGGTREPLFLPDTTTPFTTRSERYVVQNVSGSITTCSQQSIEPQPPIPFTAQLFWTVLELSDPVDPPSDTPRASFLRRYSVPIRQALLPEREYRTPRNVFADLTTGSYPHDL